MKSKIFTIIIVISISTATLSGCFEKEEKDQIEKTTKEIAIEFMDIILKGNLSNAYAYFSPSMQSQFSYEQFIGTWSYLETTYGDFESIGETTESIEAGYDIVFINCTFMKGYIIIFKIVFEQTKEISGFWTEKIDSINPYIEPNYVDTNKFTENEVVVGKYPWELPGTISIPNKE